MSVGDLLRPHSDDNRNRQVARVIYLSPGWKREAGGILRVIHKDEQFTDVEPEYNSMVLFDVLAAPAHFVSPIQVNGGVSWTRLTIGGWYHRGG
jgi:Rps23 Pro-64 3,4-dihydroxylase Tpa1-like proline 4-hydroxylase